MSRKQESGQVFVLAALSMMVLIAISAFCVNASYMFYQHQRMQAQVDEQTRLAAGSGCTASTNYNFDGGTLAITPVVPLGFFGQDGNYCDGVLTKSPGGLFGSILRFPNKISVHAVAEHGGTTESPFAFLGLSSTNGNFNCSVLFQGSAAITVTGNVLSNQTSGGIVDPTTGSFTGACNKTSSSGTAAITQGNYLYNPPPTYYDPYRVSVPNSGLGVTTVTSSCPNGWTCYKPLDSSGIAKLSSAISGSQIELMPYDVNTPGVYLIPNSFTFNPAYLNVISSTLIINTGGILGSNSGNVSGNCNSSTAIATNLCWSFTSPSLGSFKGYSIYEETPCSTTSPVSQNSFKVAGGFGFHLDGLLDMECAYVELNGGAGDAFNGAVVGDTIKLTGSGSGTAFQPSGKQPPRGAFLVE